MLDAAQVWFQSLDEPPKKYGMPPVDTGTAASVLSCQVVPPSTLISTSTFQLPFVPLTLAHAATLTPITGNPAAINVWFADEMLAFAVNVVELVLVNPYVVVSPSTMLATSDHPGFGGFSNVANPATCSGSDPATRTPSVKLEMLVLTVAASSPPVSSGTGTGDKEAVPSVLVR
jgi:hypothetical protein